VKNVHGRAITSQRSSYFENPVHHVDLVKSISSGAVPLKYAYAGSAAFTHDRYASTADYAGMMANAVSESDTLLSAGVEDLAAHSVAELGPGNGLHSIAFLRSLSERGRIFRRYLAMDFSATLLGIATARLRESFDHDFLVDTTVWDVEEQQSLCVERWRTGEKGVLVCMLGHTLGNFEDPAQALHNLGVGLRDGDILLVSVLLRPSPAFMESALTAYRADAFRCAALEPLLAAGLNLTDLDLTLRYDDSAVVGEVTLLRDARLDDMDLPGGHHFRCFLSRRFGRDEVVRLIEQTGWSIRAAQVDETDHHMTVVAARG